VDRHSTHITATNPTTDPNQCHVANITTVLPVRTTGESNSKCTSSKHSFTINLSDLQLTPADTNLLDKGLSFIPTYRFQPISRIYEVQNRLVRSLKLKDYFSKKNESVDDFDYKTKTFTEPSTWTPADHKIGKTTLETVQKIIDSTETILQNYKTFETSVTLRNTKNNLSVDERTALLRLKNKAEIVIKPADKGSATVVINRSDYVAEAHRQLHNTHYYEQLDRPIFQDNVPKINTVLQELYSLGFISEKQLKFLKANESDRHRIFYLLPKIHKPVEKWPNPKMPEGRPIVSDCGSESYRVCQYIDSFVRPLSTKHKAYIKDTYDFVEKIRGKTIPKGAILVTGDVTSLYTNMDLNRTLSVVQQAFRQYPDPERPDPQLLKLLEITLKNNDFTFNGEWFLQKVGTAMGKTYAPGLADLYLQKLDKMAVGYRITPLFYFRFLDDIHFVWTGSIEELLEFENYLNTVLPGIKIALNYSADEINFLDTTIYKKAGDDHDILQTKVYFKSTDTHQLLHKLSFHPKHTTKGVLKSQLLRFKRISSCYADYSVTCSILFDALRQRLYSYSLLRRMKREVWRLDETQRGPADDRPILPIVVPFNDLGSKLTRDWRLAVSSNKLFDKFRAITAYSNGPNLRRMLVRSLLSAVSTDQHGNANRSTAARAAAAVQTSSRPTHTTSGCTRCNSNHCRACRYITAATKFTSSTNKKTFNIRGALTCTSSNVIYLITCKKCQKQYVGETGMPLRDRINNHLSCIRSRKGTPIGLHFNSKGHDILDFTILPIERIHNNSKVATQQRRLKESTWQNLLQTAYPYGINNLNKKLQQSVD